MLNTLSKSFPTLSSRSHILCGRGICFFLFLCVLLGATGHAQTKRPNILGLSRVQIYVTSDYCTALVFYSKLQSKPFGCGPRDFGRTAGIGFASSHSFIALHTRTQVDPSNQLAEIAFWTSDSSALQKYLRSQGVAVTDNVGDIFQVTDPDGHDIGFFQLKKGVNPDAHDTLEPRIIHAGFIVHNRAAMDHFYKDILGFRLYWHGGMKDGADDWVDMQVPDGTDWLEYMLNVPANANHDTLGVMNHIALGVTDIQTARAQLMKNSLKLTEAPKLGRDGKWQLNLYDPDGTRVELMEFTPVEKPCCAPYTGSHPKP